MSTTDALITLDDLRHAQSVIAGKLHRTPIMTSESLSRQLGVNLVFKAELLQKTGAFKARGVLNKLSTLTPEEKSRGAITISAGNHAAALAYGGALSGMSVTVVMPGNAVQSKIDATRSYGAEVILHGDMADLLPRMQQIQQERGLVYIPPFDDPHVIAGQGTVGMEIMEDTTPDIVVVPVGGGGLISGVSAAVKLNNPAVKVIGVEPVGSDVVTRSLAQGEPGRLQEHTSIADGLSAPFTGARNLRHIQAFVDEVVLVTDDDIIAAMKLIMERCKLVPEPAGAASLAALLAGKIPYTAQTRVVSIISGGNVDRSRLKAIL